MEDKLFGFSVKLPSGLVIPIVFQGPKKLSQKKIDNFVKKIMKTILKKPNK